MNDEIKEILRILKSKSKKYEYCLNANISFSDESYEAHLLLDYITNLQNRIKKLEEINKQHQELNGTLRNENERLKEEKQRLLYNLEKVCEEDATTNN